MGWQSHVPAGEVILVKLSAADGQHPHRFIASKPGDVDIDHHVGI